MVVDLVSCARVSFSSAGSAADGIELPGRNSDQQEDAEER